MDVANKIFRYISKIIDTDGMFCFDEGIGIDVVELVNYFLEKVGEFTIKDEEKARELLDDVSYMLAITYRSSRISDIEYYYKDKNLFNKYLKNTYDLDIEVLN